MSDSRWSHIGSARPIANSARRRAKRSWGSRPLPVLCMSEAAARLVCTLTDNSDLPRGSGLRISLNPTTDSMSMGLAAAPELADAVVVQGEARLFLSAGVVDRTNGRTLGATASDEPAFFLSR